MYSCRAPFYFYISNLQSQYLRKCKCYSPFPHFPTDAIFEIAFFSFSYSAIDRSWNYLVFRVSSVVREFYPPRVCILSRGFSPVLVDVLDDLAIYFPV